MLRIEINFNFLSKKIKDQEKMNEDVWQVIDDINQKILELERVKLEALINGSLASSDSQQLKQKLEDDKELIKERTKYIKNFRKILKQQIWQKDIETFAKDFIVGNKSQVFNFEGTQEEKLSLDISSTHLKNRTLPLESSLKIDLQPFIKVLNENLKEWVNQCKIRAWGYDPTFFKIILFGTALKKEIIFEILPLYVCESLFDKSLQNLSPPLISYEDFRSVITLIRQKINEFKMSSGLIPRCGELYGTKHYRLVMAHPDPPQFIDWLFNLLNCLKFVRVNSIVLEEESGESIRTENGNLCGTVAAWLKKENNIYCLTAQHVLNSLFYKGPKHVKEDLLSKKDVYEDCALCRVETNKNDQNNILQVQGTTVSLILPQSFKDYESLIKDKVFKYGSATARFIEMNPQVINFNGLVSLGSLGQPNKYVEGLHLAEVRIGNSTGGDSGGPWFTPPGEEGLAYLIGTHRAQITYWDDDNQKIVEATEGYCLCACTAIDKPVEYMNLQDYQWL